MSERHGEIHYAAPTKFSFPDDRTCPDFCGAQIHYAPAATDSTAPPAVITSLRFACQADKCVHDEGTTVIGYDTEYRVAVLVNDADKEVAVCTYYSDGQTLWADREELEKNNVYAAAFKRFDSLLAVSEVAPYPSEISALSFAADSDSETDGESSSEDDFSEDDSSDDAE